MLLIIVWVAAGLVSLLVMLVAVLWALGTRLPLEHVGSATLRLKRSPEAVWGVVADFARHPEWSKGVTGIERLEDRAGRPAWRLRMGRNSFVLLVTRSEPPRLLEGTIDDDNKMFSGRWVYEILADSGGSVVKLTEHGRVPHALPRAIIHYLVGPSTNVRGHLASLAKKFGETAKPE